MKCIKKWVLSEPIVDPIDQNDILTDTCTFFDLDLKTCTTADLEFLKKFHLNVTMDGPVYGFVTWFDCMFSKGNKKITLSTSPYKKSTHWKQTIFYLDKPIDVSIGQSIAGELKVAKATDNPRELNVRLEFSVSDSA